MTTGQATTQQAESPAIRYATMPNAEVPRAVGVDPERGLTPEDVARRREASGPNTIGGQATSPLLLLRRQFRSALTLMLVVAAAISLLLGDISDGLIILTLVLLNSVLGFWQEYRAEQALAEVRRLVQVQARVVRAGQETQIPAQELVPGDVVLAKAGDVVPADVRLLAAESLAANEAPLTGEAEPRDKDAAAVQAPSGRPTDLADILFTGSTVVSGRGSGVVVATGGQTFFGQTASLLGGLERPGPFQQQLDRFANLLLVVGVAALVLIVVVNALLGRGLLTSLLFGLALIVGIVPEALPAVTAITLSLGAADLARHNVIVKRLSALQDLSSVTVLCTDKTGTLTSGVMRVQEVWGAPDTLRLAVLATTYPEQSESTIFDAIIDYARRQGILTADLDAVQRGPRLPFDPQRKRSSCVVREGDFSRLVVLGAPPSVLAVTTDYASGSRQEVDAHLQAMTERALRVVAVAVRRLPNEGLTVAEESGLTFLGLIGMGDEVRSGVPQAIARARGIDVDIKVLTGDNARTAQAVARQIGLTNDGAAVLTGEQLRSGQFTIEQACATQVFAELIPQDKYVIVQTLERAGQAVAVTGDGVNDAPALEAATVGVAMASGTDVAKEAGDLILAENDFAALVDGVGKGREILANLSKYLLYTMPGNYGILITMVIASFVLPFLPLAPAQLLLLAMLTDLPMVAISTDVVDPEELAQPERLDVRRLILLAGVLGVLGAAFNLGLVFALRAQPVDLFHTAFVYELALTTFLLAPVVRSRRPLWRERSMRRTLVLALAAAAAFMVFLVAVPNPLSALLHLTVLPAGLNLAIVAYALLYALVAEGASAIYNGLYARSRFGRRKAPKCDGETRGAAPR